MSFSVNFKVKKSNVYRPRHFRSSYKVIFGHLFFGQVSKPRLIHEKAQKNWTLIANYALIGEEREIVISYKLTVGPLYNARFKLSGMPERVSTDIFTSLSLSLSLSFSLWFAKKQKLGKKQKPSQLDLLKIHFNQN